MPIYGDGPSLGMVVNCVSHLTRPQRSRATWLTKRYKIKTSNSGMGTRMVWHKTDAFPERRQLVSSSLNLTAVVHNKKNGLHVGESRVQACENW